MTGILSNWVNQDETRKVSVAEEYLIAQVTEEIYCAMEDSNITSTVVASKLGKSKAYVSQLLSGSRNMTLRTLAQIAYALDMRVEITLKKKKKLPVWGEPKRVKQQTTIVSAPAGNSNGLSDTFWRYPQKNAA